MIPRFGFSFRRMWQEGILAGQLQAEVLELVPDHFFAHPTPLDSLSAAFPLLLHDVGLSIGTPGLDRVRLSRVSAVAKRAKVLRFTDHLAITRLPGGRQLGHLAPVPASRAALETCVENLKQVQDQLGVPLAIENIFSTFFPRLDPFFESADHFLAEVLERSGAGLLLDLTNLWLECENRGTSAEQRLAALPMNRVVAVHLAGGRRGRRGWEDTHSTAVPDEVLGLLGTLVGRAPVEDVIVEWDAHLPTLAEIDRQATRAREAWRQAERNA